MTAIFLKYWKPILFVLSMFGAFGAGYHVSAWIFESKALKQLQKAVEASRAEIYEEESRRYEEAIKLAQAASESREARLEGQINVLNEQVRAGCDIPASRMLDIQRAVRAANSYSHAP